MRNPAAIAAEPPDALRFRRRLAPLVALRAVWDAREVAFSLAERDLRARYKQAVLGFLWSLASPLSLVLVFTVFFRHVARVDTDGVPYPLFAFLGLLPWSFFSASLSTGGLSLLSNRALLSKVYCPREVFPLAGVGVAAVDTAVSTTALVVMFVVYGFVPGLTALWFPVILLVQLAFTFGVVLLVSVVVVYLRDLRHALPILLQFGLFATPVAYGLDAIPAAYRPLYSALNPLAPVIDGYRRTLVLGLAPRWELLGLAAAGAAVMLVVATLVFQRLEAGIADLV
jgi:ABC-2 type transport system permease protein/lipopolysaccharide transport system permease protein